MTDKKETEISLAPIDEKKEISLEIDDRAATRQAIINQVNTILKEKYNTQFLERSAWKAKDSKKELDYEWNYDSIVIHHQGNASALFCGDPIYETQKIQQSEMTGDQNFDDIAYHYIIGCNGNILEGRDIRFIGSHVNLNNSKKIGILLLGDYSERGEVNWDKRANLRDYIIDNLDFFNSFSVPASQGYACIVLIEVLLSVFCIDKLGGHREFSLPNDYRTCPGNIGVQFVNYVREYFKLKAPEKVK